jgi:hypothetical protein
VSDLKKVSGTPRESIVREAFKDLLKVWARSHDLVFIPEYEITTLTKDRRYVDGALLYTLRMPFGYEPAQVAEFRKAVQQFKEDLPAVLAALRDMIDAAFEANAEFRAEAGRFLAHAQETINPVTLRF